MADGAIAVPMKLEGVDEKFLLGFNSAFSEITQSVAAAFNEHSNGLGKKTFTVKSFEIGGVKGTDSLFYAVPEDVSVHGAAGILGLDTLSQFDVELDLAHNKLNLFSPDHCPGQGVYWADSAAAIPFGLAVPFGRVVLYGQLDGKQLAIGLPGPAQIHAVITTGVLSKVLGIAPDSPDLQSVAGSDPQAFHYPFQSLSIGGIVMKNPTIDVYRSDNDLLCGEWVQSGAERCIGDVGVQMQVGLHELQSLRLYFSFRENVLYATGANATHEAPPISK